MKISAIHVGLCAIIPHLAFAGQPKQWEYQRRVFERQSVGNLSTTDSGNGNGNGNTKITDSFNSYTNNGVINNGIININAQLSADIINSFNTGSINYYSAAPDCYYAKFCPTCNIVKVSKSNNTYVDQPCPVCPVETLRCPSYTIQKTTPVAQNGTSGVCNYQPPVCVSCKAVSSVSPPPAPPLTTVAVPCPTCPASSQVITCPASVVTSIASIATASGASVAQSVASSVVSAAAAITVTAPATATSVASSTIVNVPCPSCPAGTVATTVAQVTPVPATPGGSSSTPGSPGSPGSPATPGNASTPGPAAPHFTGSAGTTVTSALSIVLGLIVSTLLFL